MERLTFEGNFCDIAQCVEPSPCKYHDTGCSQKQVWERLKMYEDTGLSPKTYETCATLENLIAGSNVDLDRLVEVIRGELQK